MPTLLGTGKVMGNKLGLGRLIAAVGLLLISSSALASEPVRSAENQFNEAAQSQKREQLERIISDDFLYQHGSGRILDKATYIGMLMSGQISVSRRGPLQLSFRDYGDTVISFGESTMAGNVFGSPYDGRLRFVDVWRNNGGEWQMVHRNSELLAHEE